jgi:cytochrome c551/c552
VGLFALASVLVLPLRGAVGEEMSLEGDPFRGRKLLSEKLCTQCHSVWGHGGVLAPEMSTAVAGKSWPDLVGDFWNHTPRMIDAMADQGYPWPSLDQQEMADLISYLYYLKLFDQPGDPERGAIMFSQLRCSSCHTLRGKGGTIGGPLDSFSVYPSAVLLAQAMWNAGPQMQPAQVERWASISIFSRNEMADIQAYIRSQGQRNDRQVKLLPLPDPSKGEAVFREKRCAECHRPGGGDGPDLGPSALDMTVSEIGGMLWNHSYAMYEWMEARNIPFPHFNGSEMADLIAYLYFLGFVGEPGDATRGEGIFSDKGCARCHAGPDPVAMGLSESTVTKDPIALSAAMWNHAPEMHRFMAEKAMSWPKFDSGEMGDLAAYLRKVEVETKSGER